MSTFSRIRFAALCSVALSWSLGEAQVVGLSNAPAEGVALGVAAPAKSTVTPLASKTATGSGVARFTSGRHALKYAPGDIEAIVVPTSTNTSSRTVSGEFAPAPGVIGANMPPVSGDESQRVLKARTFPKNLNQGVKAESSSTNSTSASSSLLSASRIAGDANPQGPASITELARALRNHPDLIYQFVRNNVEFYPAYGVQKGARGAILDNQGTAYDQAMLMVELLRASGYTANYVSGVAKITAAQMQEWYGVDTSNMCGIFDLLGQAQIPVRAAVAQTAVSCPSATVTPMVSVSINHVWVKVNINGTNYVFDPSYKPHTFKTAIDLTSASITGYNATTYQTSAKSGASITTNYVQNINRSNVRSNLTTYANNLATYLRANKPTATLDDVIGGKTIVPYYGAAIRQTALPYQDTAFTTTDLTDIPNSLKPTLRVQYQGIDQTFTSDAIYGKRLTITYNASNQPVLKLDGVAVGAAGTAVTPGASTTISFNVLHNAYVSTVSNQSWNQVIKGGGTNTYLIANSWGPAGRGSAQSYQSALNELRASGATDSSEPVMGTTLAVIAAQWIAQTTHAGYISERLGNSNLVHQHQVGIAGYTTAAYVDLPGNVVSHSSPTGDTAKAKASFLNWALHLSILESTAVQQTTGVSAVSTVKLIDMAALAGQRIYNATSSNYASAVQPNLVGCSAHLTNFTNYVNAGTRLILPTRCDLAEGSWTGVGYFTLNVSNSQLGSIISAGLSGGLSTTATSQAVTASNTGIKSPTTLSIKQSSGTSYGDPIDMVSGHFLYAHEDMSVGVGDFPQALKLERLYSSGNKNRAGVLGRGWTHNLNMTMAVNSDGFQAMGEDSALDAVGTLIEMKASFDLLSNSTLPTENMVIAALGQRWFGEQLVDNTVITTRGLNGEVFVKLPDGSYNPPPGVAVKLTKNADGTYSYETLNRAVLKFDTAGLAQTFTAPSGVQVKFTYTSGVLASVANSLGRNLAFTYTSGKLTQVSDGTRNVQYAYNTTDNNLTSFTDTLSKASTYTYVQPGQMASLFYPSFPTTAAATNVYDTLGRVKQQTNALGKVYTYYFAGSRSEEIGPGGEANTDYLDSLGKVVQHRSPALQWTVNSYDGQGRLVTSTLPEGNYVQYVYDDAPCAGTDKRCTHNVKTVTRVAKAGSGLANLISSITYESAFNQVATATDARSKVTNYTYTAQGLPNTVTSPTDSAGVAPVTTYGYVSYTPSGYSTFYLPTTVTVKTSGTNSVVTTTAYNTTNKYVPQSTTVDSGTGKLNLATAYTYDAVGNLTGVDGPRSDVTDTGSNTYDSERRVTQATNAAGKLTKTEYDADGRPLKVAAQMGTQWLVSCSTYSASGKVTKAWGPALTASATTCPAQAAPVPMTDMAYDDLDRVMRITQYLTTAEGGNRVTETTYFADGKVETVKKAVGTALAQTHVKYEYTPNGLVSSIYDARNYRTVNLYDGHDRLYRQHYPLPAQTALGNANDYEQYSYDANGNVTTLRKRNGQSITQTWDNLNRLTARTYPTTADNVQYTYDLRGLRLSANYADNSHNISYVWDNAGRLTSTTAGGKALTYEYDAASNRTKTTWPDAFYTTTSFDALNRPLIVKENGSVNLASYAWDDLSRRTTVTYYNGTSVQRTYDNQGAMDTLNNVLATPAHAVQYTYSRNQVLDITNVSWTNDIYQWTGASVGSKTYAANGLNQYTSAAGTLPTHDANGNLTGDGTWTYTYDLDNRLKTANKTGTAASLIYDAQGRLRQTTIGGAALNLLYDDQALVAEYDSANTTVLRRYVHGPGTDEPIVWYEGSGTTNKSAIYADHLGSVIATANGSGAGTAAYSYGPYGEPNTTTGIRFRYTGQQLIGDLGLYYYKARFYSPTLGRFLQTDPIGYADDMNLYAYVGGNSINRNDPSGLFASPWHLYIGYQTGRELGLGVFDSLTLGFFDMAHDVGTQDMASAHKHSMATPTQSVAQATVATNDWISENLALGTFKGAGNAMGANGDAYAGGHEGHQTYSGMLSLFTTKEGLSHLADDWFPSMTSVNAAINGNVNMLISAGWTKNGPPVGGMGGGTNGIGETSFVSCK